MTLLTSLEVTQLKDWKKDAYIKFKEKITDTIKPFPCIPAVQSFYQNHLRFSFINDPRNQQSTSQLANILREYSLLSRSFGKYSTLIVFFQTPNDLKTNTILEFETLFWSQLTQLHELDQQEWPECIPLSPTNPEWEFCFHGEQYFMYCATPAHKNRNSRSFPYYMFAITPRWVLEEFQSTPSYSKKIKSHIRKRLSEYDELPPHPNLNSYGKQDNYEWKQYFLHDTPSSLDACPFLKSLKKKE
ncbi:YqcI/YcgG family protein [Halalkalibacter akibai]|uniref:YqcI/YcgG family protein n=1 Tax=Halalkalibacter akibai (strain ATCC 43226 / DSM 21942 / CIP 109018 / JCM 9157 / 1139) TaxID=1236973 RepID=W4QYS1_HALA3|nr:YqcI/YcgG family protein [Halalkalibacter akibai]GAE37231.1 hypothetical protein JCM9157_4499 [Halalkalibacter akibai JCM 9157]